MRIALLVTLLLLSGCCPAMSQRPADSKPVEAAAPTVEEAEAFMNQVEAELLELRTYREHASWVQENNITFDTDLLVSRAEEAVLAYVAEKAKEASRYNDLDLPEDLRRKFMALKLNVEMPAPTDPAAQRKLAELSTRMTSTYGTGQYCPERLGGECLSLEDMNLRMAESRDYDELLDIWTGWRTISPPMRDDFSSVVDLANAGAREMGFSDVGALWAAKYDMTEEEFRAELLRLYDQLEPLYEQLHCYVAQRLRDKYGESRVGASGPIPAHLLGNMWGQSWGNIYDVLSSEPGADEGLTRALQEKGMSAQDIVKQAESFFVSVGFDRLPQTFWERSLFTKPRDREVVCHASAWSIDFKDDLRIKMCIEPRAEDFVTIHHELGHNYYQWAYKDQPFFFAESPNDGFHEALGDTIALSVTDSYLEQAGLLKGSSGNDVDMLLGKALDKVAFLPFGLMIDMWRLDVFSGRTGPDSYNAHWWELREKYQGIKAPVARSEADFDPGAKYHVAAHVSYSRYFVAAILQYQFHKALCDVAGHQGPLYTCSIYDNKEAGARLKAMMEMGASRPWPDALEALTGQREMDARPLLEYFQPLQEWLEQQNEGVTCGW